MAGKPRWLEIAEREVGVSEVQGSGTNPRIVEFASVTTLKATTDEVPWCSAFVSWSLEEAGIHSTRSAAARSYLDWGVRVPLEAPLLGAIAVFSRTDNPAHGHVAFWLRWLDGGRVEVLGGNQGNQVRVSAYPRAELLALRWPAEVPTA